MVKCAWVAVVGGGESVEDGEEAQEEGMVDGYRGLGSLV
jgi:hypothetical protein